MSYGQYYLNYKAGRKIAPFLPYSILNFILWRNLFAARWPHTTRTHTHTHAEIHLEIWNTKQQLHIWNMAARNRAAKKITRSGSIYFSLLILLSHYFFYFLSRMNLKFLLYRLTRSFRGHLRVIQDSSMLHGSLQCARGPLVPSGPRLSADSLSAFSTVLRRPKPTCCVTGGEGKGVKNTAAR